MYAQDWDNIAIFGNTSPHLHAHLIPRYNSLRKIHGIEFLDPNPKGNYSPYPEKEIDEKTLMQIKIEIDNVLCPKT